MRLSLKFAIPAFLGLGLATTAQGAISTAALPTDPVGELYLTVWDTDLANPLSYIRDLGVSLSDFIANPFLSFTPDSVYTNQFLPTVNDLSTLRWDVVGADQQVAGLGISGFFSTVAGDNPPPTPPNFQNIQQVSLNIANYVITHNEQTGENDFSIHGSTIHGPGVPSYAGNLFTKSDNLGDQAIGFTTMGEVGEALQFFSFSFQSSQNQNQTSPFVPTDPVAFLPLVFDEAGNLASVPVPAAFWLFGSAVMGLVAVSRRRASA